jgi:hypothetical protein
MVAHMFWGMYIFCVLRKKNSMLQHDYLVFTGYFILHMPHIVLLFPEKLCANLEYSNVHVKFFNI